MSSSVPHALVFAACLALVASPARAGFVWIEGEAATASQVRPHAADARLPRAAFSGGGFLSHDHATQPGEATYQFLSPEAGDHHLWLRMMPQDPPPRIQLQDGAWQDLVTSNAVQQFSLGGGDSRSLGWVHAGTVSLRPGTNTLRLRFAGPPRARGVLDCLVFSRQPFEPYGIEKPGAAEAARSAALADEGEWRDFNPPSAAPDASSPINLRWLNERAAGEHGRIEARDGRFVNRATGQPVRFWAVNGPPHDLTGEALKACAAGLAARGVNLVRIHGAVFDSATGELQPDRVRHLAEVIEAMKAEGIYTLLSIYFPLWMRPQAGLPWLEGYDGRQHPFAALMFNDAFTRRYEDWWRAILETRLADGTPIAADPAVLGLEIQNEDSFFFWTFSEANLPEPQRRLLERQFGDWLIARHGSLDQAFAAWGGPRLPRDNAAEGRAAFRPLWNLVNERTPRDRETAAFLYETQEAFYRRVLRFLRARGFEGLVTCSNWTTASQEVLGPLEKLSYTVGDFLDRHGYVSCRSAGRDSEWSVRNGHTYIDRSVLRFEPETPGAPRQFRHPIIDIEYNGKPSMISETTWNRPNRHRGEAPLFLAIYGALQDTDAVVHFAFDGADWDVKPRFFMQPWTLMAPTQIGQFPAAALIYRQGLVQPGAVLADLTLNLTDLLALKGTPLPQDADFDELRLRDVPAGTEITPGDRIDPRIHFAGRTRVTFTTSPTRVRVEDLRPWIDHASQQIRSTTGEVNLDYGRGVLTLNAPSAQGVSGDLRAAGDVRLRDLSVVSPLDTGHIILVALDRQSLATSRRMLLQVMSEERPTGWRTIPQGRLHLIESIGRNPWRIRKLAGTVRLHRPDAARLVVQPLDPTGLPAAPLGDARHIPLQEDVVSYLLSAGPEN